MTTYLRTTIYLISLMALFLAPLMLDSSIVRMYDIPKAALFKVFVAIASLLWILWLVLYKQTERLIRLSPIAFSLLLVGIAFFASSSLSHPIMTSFEGVYERQMGFLGYFAAVMLTLILATIVDTKKEKKWIIYLIITSSLIIAIHGLLSISGIINWPKGSVNGARLAGLMGNANFLANQLVIALPLIFLLPAKRILQSILFLLILLATIFSQTRGAFFAILVTSIYLLFNLAIQKEYGSKINQYGTVLLNILIGTFLTGAALSYPSSLTVLIFCTLSIASIALYFIRFQKKNYKTIFISIIGGILILFAFKGIDYSGYLKSNNYIPFPKYAAQIELEQNTKKEHPAPLNKIEALTSRFFSSYKFFSTNSRVFIWKDTVRFITHNGIKNAILGIGVENFRRDFMPHKSLESEKRSKNIHFDNPHNSLLYYLASVGLLGTFAILFLLFKMWQTCSSNKQNGLILKATLIIYLSSSFTNVDMIASIGLIAAVAAIMLLESSDKHQPMKLLTHKYSLIPIATIIAIFSIWNLTSTIKVYRADQFYYKGLSERKPSIALQKLNKAIKENPNEAQYYQGKAEFLLKFVRKMPTPERRTKMVAQINETLMTAIPFSWQPENHYITLYNAKIAIKDFTGARKALTDCLRISPNLEGVQKAYYKLQGPNK